MKTESLRVVFGGPIFNFVELRAGLERRGHRFHTHSDTEVIVHLYERGDDFVDRAQQPVRHRAVGPAPPPSRAGARPQPAGFYAHDRGRLAFASG